MRLRVVALIVVLASVVGLMPAAGEGSGRLDTVVIYGDEYTLRLKPGTSGNVLAMGSLAGIVWSPPQSEAGEDLGRHPTEPASVYLSPYRLGGGNLEEGAQKLTSLPLLIRKDGLEHYIKLNRLAPAGDWVVLWSFVHTPGAAQHSGRLDAVNVLTKQVRFVTEAFLAGGHFFDWRAEPGKVIWQKRRTTDTGVELVESVALDLETGERRSVPPEGPTPASTEPDGLTPDAIAFWDQKTGLLAGQSGCPVQCGDYIIALSEDGGQRWRQVYRGTERTDRHSTGWPGPQPG